MTRADGAGPDAKRPGQDVILVAENDERHRMVLHHVFKAAGLALDLRFVGDGGDLLDYLHRRGRHAENGAAPWPAVVLLDLHMPGVDGTEALRRIRADDALRALPVVVLSTSAEQHHVERAYEAGANAYLVKLGDFSRLVTQMQHFAVFWLQTAYLPGEGPG